MLNNIYFFIITGSSFDDSSVEHYRLGDHCSFDDPILDTFLQSSEKPDGYSGSDIDSDKDDCDHSHAKKTPGVLCYIHKLFVP